MRCRATIVRPGGIKKRQHRVGKYRPDLYSATATACSVGRGRDAHGRGAPPARSPRSLSLPPRPASFVKAISSRSARFCGRLPLIYETHTPHGRGPRGRSGAVRSARGGRNPLPRCSLHTAHSNPAPRTHWPRACFALLVRLHPGQQPLATGQARRRGAGQRGLWGAGRRGLQSLWAVDLDWPRLADRRSGATAGAGLPHHDEPRCLGLCAHSAARQGRGAHHAARSVGKT